LQNITEDDILILVNMELVRSKCIPTAPSYCCSI